MVDDLADEHRRAHIRLVRSTPAAVVEDPSQVIAEHERVPAVEWSDVRQASSVYHRPWLRPYVDRWCHLCRPLGLVAALQWPDRWSQAGGPYMQQQALRGSVARRAGDEQRKLSAQGSKEK